jgi:PAS domain S-box-containing protein
MDLSSQLLEESSLISKTDAKGNITYANQKFLDISGYTLEEIIGQTHKIINSGYHPKSLWEGMYNTTIRQKQMWYNPCIINKSKDGSLYYVKTWIQAEFDSNNKLQGLFSIRHDITEFINNQLEIERKNTYLEHAAKILRHDMHSGINTYIPRGIKSLTRRLSNIQIKELRLESPLRMLHEGLKHTQKVYKGVYEFTNLVKYGGKLTKSVVNITSILNDYLQGTSYSSDVIIEPLPSLEVNESLFCTAIDNLIRNGLKYNDSKTKYVKVYNQDTSICVEDNGRGLTNYELVQLSKPYTRKKDQKESGSGLGLNIALAILEEHGFEVTCMKNFNGGTTFNINYL